MGARAQPLRTCVGCRRVRPKPELVRLVRRADGSVGVDPTGRADGRGAYLCPGGGCLEEARRRLTGALRAQHLDLEAVRTELTDVGVA